MRKPFIVLLPLALVVTTVPNLHANMFKCVSQGSTVYQDRPCPLKKQKKILKDKQPTLNVFDVFHPGMEEETTEKVNMYSAMCEQNREHYEAVKSGEDIGIKLQVITQNIKEFCPE